MMLMIIIIKSGSESESESKYRIQNTKYQRLSSIVSDSDSRANKFGQAALERSFYDHNRSLERMFPLLAASFN